MRFSPGESDESHNVASYLRRVAAQEDVKIKVRRFFSLRGTILATDSVIRECGGPCWSLIKRWL
jgi:hypothetical protein